MRWEDGLNILGLPSGFGAAFGSSKFVPILLYEIAVGQINMSHDHLFRAWAIVCRPQWYKMILLVLVVQSRFPCLDAK